MDDGLQYTQYLTQLDIKRAVDRIANNPGGPQGSISGDIIVGYIRNLYAYVDHHTKLLDEHEEVINQHTASVDTLSKRVAAQKKRIQSLSERIESLEASIECHDSLDTHTDDIASLEERLAKLESFIRNCFRQGRDVTERKAAVFNDNILVLVDPAKCKEKEALDVLVSDDPEWHRSIMIRGRFKGLLADTGVCRGSASRVSVLVKSLKKDDATGEERVERVYAYALRGTFLWDDADIIVRPGTQDRVIHNSVDPEVTTLGGSGEEPTYANKPISELREKYGWPTPYTTGK